MKQYVCSICGYIYDEEKSGKWEDLPNDWKCPVCSAGKEAFRLKEDPSETVSGFPKPEAEKDFTAMEMSVICSNLARGCEKQYLQEQADDFRKLAEFFRGEAATAEHPTVKKLLELIENDLSAGFPYANSTAGRLRDRGALRALAWSEKVTRMLQSLLTPYEVEGDNMLENTSFYVCTVCGFIYAGDAPPELCPVCKVPSWKFEKSERRTDE